MVIFYSYVKLPEGTFNKNWDFSRKDGGAQNFADPQPSISPERSVLQLAWRHAVGNIGRRPITCRDRGKYNELMVSSGNHPRNDLFYLVTGF